MADCKKIKVKIEENIFLGVKKEDLPQEIKMHMKNCDQCSILYDEKTHIGHVASKQNQTFSAGNCQVLFISCHVFSSDTSLCQR